MFLIANELRIKAAAKCNSMLGHFSATFDGRFLSKNALGG
jgi:hypothetical protein